MIYFTTCSLIWGLTWISIKFQLHAVDPNVAVFYRFVIASALLFAVCAFKKQNLLFKKEEHIRFLGQGLFMFCLNFLLTYWASGFAPSPLIALAFTTLIYFNMFGARIFLGQPFEKKVIFGALISLIGIFLISYNELETIQQHPKSLLGFFISLVATVSASIGNIISAQNRQRNIPIFSNNAWGMFYGSVLSLIYCLVMQKSFVLNIDTKFLISFTYLTVFGTVISFSAYLKLIELVGPAKAAFTSVVSPVIAILASMMIDEMTLTVLLIIGVLFCLLGNVVALTPSGFFKKIYANSRI